MLRRGCERCAKTAGWVSIAGNVCLAATKWAAGLACGSQALLADALHSSVDVVGSTITLVMLRLSRRPASTRYPYGFGKLEDVSALVIYLILVAAGSYIVADALHALLIGHMAPPALPALLAAALSIAVNAFMYYFISCAGRQVNSPSLIALGYENKVDALSSVAALLGIFGAILGFTPLDPVAAIIVAGFIISESARELYHTAQRLTDKALPRTVRAELARCVTSTPHVRGLLAAKTRHLGGASHADVDILVDAELSVETACAVADSVAERLRANVAAITSVRVVTHPATRDIPPEAARVLELLRTLKELRLAHNRSGGRP